jgi:hypothetical protein
MIASLRFLLMSVRVGIRPSAAVLLALLINLPTMADARGKNPVILQITNNTVGDVISPRRQGCRSITTTWTRGA